MSAAHRTITGEELRLAIFRRYPRTPLKPALICNGVYHATTKDWVDGVFAPYVEKLFWSLAKDKWRKRGNQCEHFAFRCVLAAVDAFDQAAQRDETITAESVAVGVLPYTVEATKSGHAILTWFIDGEFREWEPQTRKWVTLTKSELSSAWTPVFL